MNLLIICEELNNSAAGRVFRKFIDAFLKKQAGLFILANEIDQSLKDKTKYIELGQPALTHSRLFKLLFTLFNFDFEGYSRLIKGQRIFIQLTKEYSPDIILVFSASYGFASVNLGYFLSKKYDIPLAVHCADPMPSPPGWGEHPLLRNATIRYIGKRLRFASYLSYTNPTMLESQVNTLAITGKTKTAVIFNPGPEDHEKSGCIKSNKNIFLFAGSLYNKRNPQKLIDAFALFIKSVPDAKLIFLGSMQTRPVIPEDLNQSVEIIGWTDFPEQYMNSAGVLIDIDAEIEEDVFISSKLNNYIYYNKPILIISQPGSPSRRFLEECRATVFFSKNETKDILSKLLIIQGNKLQEIDFNERNKIREKLKPDQLISELLSHLKQVI
jgi:glycosyltransferase involved in cell wall biosynthesis